MSEALPAHDTAAAVAFLKARGSTATCSCVWIDAAGKKGLFETATFKLFEQVGIDKITAWINERQGRANLYYSVNTLLHAMTKKAEREDLKDLVSLHVDLDPRQGEDQDAAQARIIKQLEGLEKPPTWIINSGGGVQGIWDLTAPVPINGDLAIAEDLKMYNVQIERDLGGDHCHNVDRIMRLPGTINLPDERKLKKGRRPALAYIVRKRDTAYTIADFTKAVPLAEPGGPAGPPAPVVAGKQIVNFSDDANLDKIADWAKRAIANGHTTDPEDSTRSWFTDGLPDRSNMVFACVCEMSRKNVAPEIIASLLTDPNWKFSEQVIEKDKGMQREVNRLIKRAKEFILDKDLFDLNEKYAVVKIGSATAVVSFNKKTKVPIYESFEAFAQFQNKYRKKIPGEDKNGNPVIREIPLGTWWLGHEDRRQYSGVVYRPDVDADEVDGELNLWRGFACGSVKGEKHLPYLEHLRINTCKCNERHYNYLIGLFATIVQKRAEPSEVTTVLISPEEGTGKTVVGKHLGALFGHHCIKITKAEQLLSSFNANFEFCQLWLSEEVTYSSAKEQGALKSIISDSTIRIERKGFDANDAVNHMNGIITSNQQHVVPAGTHARRYFVLNVGIEQMGNGAYFANIEDQLKAGGYENLLYFLLNYDLATFNIKEMPQTEGLAEQKSLSRTGVESLIEHICDEGRLPCQRSYHPDCVDTAGEKSGKGFWQWAAENFPALKGQDVRVNAGQLRKWTKARWSSGSDHGGYQFPPLAELRATFEAKFGAPVDGWENKATDWPVAGPRNGRGADGIPF
jgi:Family of unknown function (DUF5906)